MESKNEMIEKSVENYIKEIDSLNYSIALHLFFLSKKY